MRWIVGTITLIAAATPFAASCQVATPPLTGVEAWAAVTGNTVTGMTNDGPYTEFFKPDGTVIHVDNGGREAGRWMLKAAAVCFTFPSDPDEQVECRRIEVQGSHGAFIATDGSRYPFDMMPGDPQHLS